MNVPVRPSVAVAVALAVALGAGAGCKKEFEPGVFQLTAVFQVLRDAEGEEVDRTEMRVAGSARWTFDYDGEFLVEYQNYGVGFERACTGTFRGQYALEQQQVRMQVKKSAVPAYCRPEAERVYTWQRGAGGGLILERHWEGNQFMSYRLDPAE